jgi:rfaE bifunctional protein kinase chain/domain
VNPASAPKRSAPAFTRDSLAARVRSFRGKRVLVVGDVILDRYLWGRSTRVSPEAPVLVVDVDREEYRLGGAANVAHNVASLGATPVLFGVCGTDMASTSLCALLRARHVDPDAGMIEDAGRRTTLKTRIIAHHQQVLRADEETRDVLADSVRARLIERLEGALDGADAVIVSDYGKGVLSGPLLERLLPELTRRGIPTSVDPKEEQFFRYKGVTVVTPNVAEAAQAWGRRIRSEAELSEAGFGLREKLASKAVLITRGEEGMSLFDEDGHTHIPTKAREVYDVTGAGDTVVATMGVALAARAPLAEACVLANHAAGLVVAHLGTAAATADELVASLGDVGGVGERTEGRSRG